MATRVRAEEGRVVSSLPFVSIVMPVRNESSFIGRSLGAILAQDYPKDRLEILISDGMSTDDTRAVIETMAAASDVPITIVDNPGLIVPTGMNTALQQARGEVIVRVDGHCEIAPDYVRRSVEHLASSGAAGVGGPIVTVSEGLVGETIAIAMSSNFGVGGAAFRTGRSQPLEVDSVAFPAYTRRAISDAGPLDEELMRNQDDEYNYRLRKIGHTIMLFPDLEARYYSRQSMRRLWRQYFQYGVYKVRVLQKHPKQMKGRQFAPSMLVGCLLTTLLASPWSLLPLISILTLYCFANLTASIVMALLRCPRTVVLLPLAFATLHLAYGSGFLVGLLRFARRWGDRSGKQPSEWHFSSPVTPHPATKAARPQS